MANDSQARAYGEGLGQGANSVLGKARLILESFQHDDVELSLSELSRRTGISKASVHRLAQELVDWGMLERSGFEYRLGMRAFELGSRVPRFRVLRDAARPFMERLHFATKEAVHLAVMDGLEVLFLEKVAAAQSAKPSRIAGRMPLHAASTGKVMLAYSPTSVLEEVVSRDLDRLTPHTTVAPGLLVEQIRRIRANGWGVEHEEIIAGYCSVAVPLFTGNGLLLGALSVTAPTYRADVAKLATALTEVSRRMSSANLIN
ncbi:IclR family transcriptional regulator [Micromonospora sp. SH-82]|uniref:IclR family transcriptional regulator n=1 Tax=Micromonospora sp. SH-82 TaxID=3132938 RepID=UPI003EBF3011